MSKNICFYPVDNGQSALVTVDDSTHVLFDLRQVADEPTDAQKKWTDIHAELLKVVPKDNGVYHLSVACFSHDDDDHCSGFERVFRTGEPSTKQSNLIQVDELWVPVRVITEDGNDCSDSAKALREEANRRLDLAVDPKQKDAAEKKGNRIVVFGNTIDDRIGRLPATKRFTAGQVIETICGGTRTDFEMFVHSPFRKLSDDDTCCTNDTCIVGQVVLTEGDKQLKIVLGGDCGCSIWKDIWSKTEQHDNEDRLDSDVFVAPHHGSYTFFTEKEADEGRKEARDNPAQESMNVIGRLQQGGIIVCSSRPVSDANYNDNNPPHTEATKHFQKRAKDVGGKFRCTMEDPSKEAPKPMVIELTAGGVRERDSSTAAVMTAAGVSVAPRWGARG